MNLVSARHARPQQFQMANATGNVDAVADIVVISSVAAITMTLPPAAGKHGSIVMFKRASSASTGSITIKGFGTETVERSNGVFNNTYTLAATVRRLSYVSDGIRWHMLHFS